MSNSFIIVAPSFEIVALPNMYKIGSLVSDNINNRLRASL